MIKTKRVYEDVDDSDGLRFFVERLWPRGIKKENLHMAAWIKDVSPSPELRTWYQHDVTKWQEFSQKYIFELESKPEAWTPLADAALQGTITLLFATRDTEHNSATVLKSFLEEKLKTYKNDEIT